MAITTFTGDLSAQFPAGTSLEARPASNWPAIQRPPAAGTTPVGAATATAVSNSSGVVSFTGLADSTEYYVSDAAGTRYVRITTFPMRQEVMTDQADVAGGYPKLNAKHWVPSADLIPTVVNVCDPIYAGGADPTGAADSRPACAAAHLAAEALGNAVVLYPRGTYLFDSTGPIPVTPNRAGTGWLRISGYGATIKIGPNMAAGSRGFLKSGRTADDQTLARVIVEGFEIDGQKLTAPASEGLRGGNIFATTGTSDGKRLNFEDLIFRDIYSHGIAKPSTYGTGTGTFNNQTHLYLACYHTTQGEAQNTIKRLKFLNVRMESGVHGIFFGGSVASGVGCEVYYDDVYHADCLHDYLETHTTATGSNFQAGQAGYGDRVVYERCEGRYANDTSFEVDAAQYLVYRDCVTKDPRNAGFYARDFHAPISAQQKQWITEGCRAVFDNVIPDESNYPCHGIQIGALSTDAWGQVVIRDYLYECSTAMKYVGGSTTANKGHGIYMYGPSVKTLRLENVECRETGIAADTSAGSSEASPVYLKTQNADGEKCRLIIDGLHVKNAGTVTNLAVGTLVYIPLTIGASGNGADWALDIRNFDVNLAFPSNAKYAWRLLQVGRETLGYTCTVRGGSVIRRVNIISATSTAGGAVAFRFGTTDILTIEAPLVVEQCNFGGLISNNSELEFQNAAGGAGTTNAPNIVFRDCKPRLSSTTIASAATVNLPPAWDLFTISGTADITAVSASWTGRRVTFLFSGTAATNGVVDNGTTLNLAGNFAYTPNDTLTLIFDGTNWLETGRAVN